MKEIHGYRERVSGVTKSPVHPSKLNGRTLSTVVSVVGKKPAL